MRQPGKISQNLPVEGRAWGAEIRQAARGCRAQTPSIPGGTGLCYFGFPLSNSPPITQEAQHIKGGNKDRKAHLLPGSISTKQMVYFFCDGLTGVWVIGYQADLTRLGIEKDVVTIATITPNLGIKPQPVDLREKGLNGARGPPSFFAPGLLPFFTSTMPWFPQILK